jgi:excinuclease ABC subunit C
MRGKKMVQSVLDGIDGIGPKTKKKLLSTFGSVAGIREASWEQLLNVVDEHIAEKIREQI